MGRPQGRHRAFLRGSLDLPRPHDCQFVCPLPCRTCWDGFYQKVCKAARNKCFREGPWDRPAGSRELPYPKAAAPTCLLFAPQSRPQAGQKGKGK